MASGQGAAAGAGAGAAVEAGALLAVALDSGVCEVWDWRAGRRVCSLEPGKSECARLQKIGGYHNSHIRVWCGRYAQ